MNLTAPTLDDVAAAHTRGQAAYDSLISEERDAFNAVYAGLVAARDAIVAKASADFDAAILPARRKLDEAEAAAQPMYDSIVAPVVEAYNAAVKVG